MEKHKKLEMPDLRHGVEGSVVVKDTNEYFAVKSPNTVDDGSMPASPNICSAQTIAKASSNDIC